MSLKPDEEFVKHSLVKALSANNAWEGEDPPDIYLELNGERIAVEITRLSPISFGEGGEIENRNSQDIFGIKLCNHLNSSLGERLPPEVELLLVLHMPVQNGKKFKKQLYEYVKEFISRELSVGDAEDIELLGSRIEISVIKNREHSEKKISGAIVNENSNAFISRNAQLILAERIKDKVVKCKDINHKEKLWLAFFNDYWLADHESYLDALRKLDIEHYFDRIYLVLDTGACHQIY